MINGHLMSLITRAITIKARREDVPSQDHHGGYYQRKKNIKTEDMEK